MHRQSSLSRNFHYHSAVGGESKFGVAEASLPRSELAAFLVEFYVEQLESKSVSENLSSFFNQIEKTW